MTAPHQPSDPPRTWEASTIQAVLGGGVFLFAGAGLVVHLLTGTPLPLALSGFAVVCGVVAASLCGSASALRRQWLFRVRAGIGAGLVATLAYDFARWLLVAVGGLQLSPFAAFPFFGQALLGGRYPGTAENVAGYAFHLLNGVTFGIAYAVWFGDKGIRWGIGFGLGLEAFMLALYPGWLDIRSVKEFTQMSIVGHLVFGSVLGWLARRLIAEAR